MALKFTAPKRKKKPRHVPALSLFISYFTNPDAQAAMTGKSMPILIPNPATAYVAHFCSFQYHALQLYLSLHEFRCHQIATLALLYL
jgi:hypothetical protein